MDHGTWKVGFARFIIVGFADPRGRRQTRLEDISVGICVGFKAGSKGDDNRFFKVFLESLNFVGIGENFDICLVH